MGWPGSAGLGGWLHTKMVYPFCNTLLLRPCKQIPLQRKPILIEKRILKLWLTRKFHDSSVFHNDNCGTTGNHHVLQNSPGDVSKNCNAITLSPKKVQLHPRSANRPFIHPAKWLSSFLTAHRGVWTGSQGGQMTPLRKFTWGVKHGILTPRFLERNIFWYRPTRNLRHDYIIFWN